MRVAVTGASGFVGGWIARELAAAGHDVHAFGRRAAADLPLPLAAYTSWDLLDGPIQRPIVDAVVHCAAHVAQGGPQARYTAVNVEGTRAALESFSRPPLFVHISSGSVYAHNAEGSPIREDAPGHGVSYSAYATTKALSEAVVAADPRRTIILRPRAVYGPGDTTLLPKLLGARRCGYLMVPGNGTNRVSVTHVANLAHAVGLALSRAGVSGAFNIADEVSPTMDVLLRSMLRQCGAAEKVIYIPRAVAWTAAHAVEIASRACRRSGEPVLTRYTVANLADGCLLDLTRAREVLGYRPVWTFRDADGPWLPAASSPG